jgi:A/G-specific adenine glycosylase
LPVPQDRLRGFVGALLRWFSRERRFFPWRESSDPYVLLVAEILLKQTTAAAVALFLPGFLKAYPAAVHLARARTRRLQKLLQPLGLSRQRAEHLRALGVALQQLNGGLQPGNVEFLPGVGSYTASAVRCFAFGLPVGVVDTNVTRVLGRAFSITGSRSEARKSPEFWAVADALVATRPKQAREVNWALLDLANSVCVPREPRCASCPVRARCDYGRRFTAALSGAPAA